MAWSDCAQPGYYEDGAFGIRHENILVVKRRDAPHAVSHVWELWLQQMAQLSS